MIYANLGVSSHYHLYDTHSLVYYCRVHRRIDCRRDHAHAPRLRRNDIARYCGLDCRRADRANFFPTSGGFQISSRRIYHVDHWRGRHHLPGAIYYLVLRKGGREV
jgi:hypothetical protein